MSVENWTGATTLELRACSISVAVIITYHLTRPGSTIMLSTPCPICNHPCSVAANSCPDCGHVFQPKARQRPDSAAAVSEEKRKLIPCPDCGHSCSVAAASCPNCGRPFKQPPYIEYQSHEWGGGTGQVFYEERGRTKGHAGKIIALLTVLLLLAGGAASYFLWLRPPPEGVLTGEVFIVTKGAQSFKLGLVEVVAIPEKQMLPFVEQKELAARASINKFKAQLGASQKELETSQQEYNNLKSAYDAALAKQNEADALAVRLRTETLYSSPSSSYYGSASEEPSAETQRLNKQAEKAAQQAADAARKVADLRNKLASVEQDLSGLRSRVWKFTAEAEKTLNDEFLFTGLPGSKIKVTTDADGKFALKLPAKGKFAIAARAQRRVFDSTEQYYWLIWVSLDGAPSKHIMLSNNNLLSEESSDAVLRLKDLIKIPTEPEL